MNNRVHTDRSEELADNLPFYPVRQTSNDFVDIQIATAKQYPRNIAQFKKVVEAILTPDIASTCYYKLPARDDGHGGKKEIPPGGNIRLAEILVPSWKNCRIQVIDDGETDDGRFVKCVVRVIDLENNYASEIPAKRRISGRKGRYSDDMIGVTTNAAYAIAYRNGARKLLGPWWDWGFKLALSNARADVDKNFEKRRKDALDFFKWRGITEDRILEHLERDSVDQVTSEDILTLLGLVNAIDGGEITIKEVFPSDEDEGTEQKPKKKKKSNALKGSRETSELLKSINSVTGPDALDVIVNDYKPEEFSEVQQKIIQSAINTKRSEFPEPEETGEVIPDPEAAAGSKDEKLNPGEPRPITEDQLKTMWEHAETFKWGASRAVKYIKEKYGCKPKDLTQDKLAEFLLHVKDVEPPA